MIGGFQAWLESLLGPDGRVALAAAILSSATYAFGRFIHEWRKAAKARTLADNEAFNDALASDDLVEIGGMLRDRFGTVTVEALLDDKVTQERVFKSLDRLTELLNQPAPDDNLERSNLTKDADYSIDTDAGVETSPATAPDDRLSYIELLEEGQRQRLGLRIAEIAKIAALNIRVSGVWTGLAAARRHLEMELLPLLSGGRKTLTPRIFWNPRLRAAMGSFLSIANRAIHGVEVSIEDANRALKALEFIATALPITAAEDLPIPADQSS